MSSSFYLNALCEDFDESFEIRSENASNAAVHVHKHIANMVKFNIKIIR